MWEKIKQNQVLLLLLLTGAVYFFLRYITPLTGPILLAMLFVTVFGPLLKKMQGKLHLHRQIGAVILLLVAGSLLIGLIWVLSFWVIGSLPEWIEGLQGLGDEINQLLHSCCEVIGPFVGVDSGYLENTIMNRIGEGLNALGQHTVPGVLSQSLGYVRILGSLGAFLATFIISTVLLAKDYDEIMNRLLDREECHVLLEVICGVIRYIATYVRAQAVIMTIIGFLAAVVLGFAGIYHGVLWGILAGILDALPFIGTGIVLMPMVVVQLVQGYYGRAAICVLLYIACVFIRELLEPRLIGSRIGVSPIAVLLSLYVGIQLFGVWGIVKGPLGFILIYQTWLSIRKREEV